MNCLSWRRRSISCFCNWRKFWTRMTEGGNSLKKPGSHHSCNVWRDIQELLMHTACIIPTFFIMKFFQCLFGSFDDSGRISHNRSESGAPTIVFTFTTQQQSSLQGYCRHTDTSVTECEWSFFSNFIDTCFFSVNYEVNFFSLGNFEKDSHSIAAAHCVSVSQRVRLQTATVYPKL